MKPDNSHLSYYGRWLLAGAIIGLLFLVLHGDVKLPSILTDSSSDSTGIPASGFSAAIERAAPAVVSISTYTYVENQAAAKQSKQSLSERFLAKGSPHAPKRKTLSTSGSGVIINTDGYIVTNYHVIKDNDEIRIRLSDGRIILGDQIGSDPDTDLAVVKINADKLPAIKIGNSKKLKVGDIVLAIGDPFNIGQTVTQGILSATGRSHVSQNTYENFLQTDAAINPGNSGGALINSRGEIIGINSNIYSNTGNFQGISFAIPIDLALQVSRQIIQNGYVVRGWLGVEGQDISPQLVNSIAIQSLHGILITDVDADGPGDKAGLRPGDIITRINNHEIYTATDILNLVAAGRPGDIFQIEGLRKRQSFITRVKLGQRPLMSH